MDLLYKVRLYQDNGRYSAVLVASDPGFPARGEMSPKPWKTWVGPWPIILRLHWLIAQ